MEPRKRLHLVNELMDEANLMMAALEKAMQGERFEETHPALHGTHHAQGHLYAVVGDVHNFAVLDLRGLAASMFVSLRTAADHSWLRWFFVESLAYTLLAQRYVVPVHAACIARDGAGLLLCGSSAAGKSTLA